MLAGLRPNLRTALLAGAAFILVATCSALGWLLPWDEPLLRLVVASRSCTSVALSSLASAAGAIEVVGVFTGLLVLGVAFKGAGPRAAARDVGAEPPPRASAEGRHQPSAAPDRRPSR